MKRMTKGGYNGYRITPTEWGFYVTIASEKHNQFRTYEYDGACGTREQVEAELKKYSFEEIVKRYREQCVYCECVEEIC